MREILFRGKRANGEWVEGYYYKAKYYRTDDELCDYISISYPNEYNRESDNFLVRPETVGQYTGLTDKNGKKIFEGDIIKIGNKTRYVFFGVCRYRHTNYGEYAVDLSVKYANNCEVIGNIHDNPELLEVSE